MFKSILVPTDGSDNANAALQLGADLAAKYGAKLTLLHVAFRGGEISAARAQEAESRFETALQAEGKSPSRHPEWSREHQVLDYLGEVILDEAASTARDQGAINIDTQLDYGATSERVLYWEKHAGADLIVMGSRGYSELQGLLLGSVSHTVHHQCDATCVTVKQREGGPTDAFSGIATVLAAVDGSDHAFEAVEVASDIASKYGARLAIVHVKLKSATVKKLLDMVDAQQLSADTQQFLHDRQTRHGSAWALDFGLASTTPAKQVFAEVGELVLLKAKRLAERKGITDVSTHLDNGDPAAQIVARAGQEHADLIVLGDRGLGEVKGMLVGSVSNKIQHLAPCTAISVKQSKRAQ
ncbi:MAG: universal stress protein [Gammaproteobacteria bacterium]